MSSGGIEREQCHKNWLNPSHSNGNSRNQAAGSSWQSRANFSVWAKETKKPVIVKVMGRNAKKSQCF